ncbi:hypothetical protein PIB30_074035 [Stylosanthes scabra]|uniref:Uncharacterized protein n=1 Tax=Stylosanthes scabra TaxID=79078 RepID=A0ABU6SQ89_9FABA|nr:hypothetical protein [Stylosanthes scabra]
MPWVFRIVVDLGTRWHGFKRDRTMTATNALTQSRCTGTKQAWRRRGNTRDDSGSAEHSWALGSCKLRESESGSSNKPSLKLSLRPAPEQSRPPPSPQPKTPSGRTKDHHHCSMQGYIKRLMN